MEIPVFVINLSRSIERREHTTRQLNELGVSFQIVEAFDGAELSENEIRNNSDYGIYKSGIHSSYLRKEEIGCVLSHLQIFRQMVDEKIELACILEDDNNYLEDFKYLLVSENINTSLWDILYLGHHSACTTEQAQSRNKKLLTPFNYFIGEAVEVPYGAYGYIINNDAAKKMLRRALPIRIPFDSYLGNSPALGIRTFLLTPPCVLNISLFTSTIYSDKNLIYSSPFWKTTDMLIEKIYLFIPYLRKIRVWIYINTHSIFRYLRKSGIIKNHYAKI
jgi:glycosyl transferase, family 25